MYIFIEYLVSEGVYRKVLSGLQDYCLDTPLFPLTNSEANTKPWAGCVPGCVWGVKAQEVGVLLVPWGLRFLQFPRRIPGHTRILF